MAARHYSAAVVVGDPNLHSYLSGDPHGATESRTHTSYAKKRVDDDVIVMSQREFDDLISNFETAQALLAKTTQAYDVLRAGLQTVLDRLNAAAARKKEITAAEIIKDKEKITCSTKEDEDDS